MAKFDYYTKNYKHKYSFNFQGNEYLVHSIVRLTEYGQKYLESAKREVILTEVFYNWNNVLCWKYEFKTFSAINPVKTISTDVPPEQLIEEVIHPATYGYMEREVLGIDAPSYTSGKKVAKKDWEITEVKNAWLIFIAVFILAAIFKDWYVQLMIRLFAGLYFGVYRQSYINANTAYIHDEDIEMTRRKIETLRGGINNE